MQSANPLKLYYAETDTPIGPITLIGDHNHLYALEFGTFEQKYEKIMTWCQKHKLPTQYQELRSAFAQPIHQLKEYFQGERIQFSISYQLYGTEFQKRVWHILANIPFGETWSYKDIATCLESPKAVRAVGGAMNKNPISIIVPCHRVVGHNGKLVGFGGGLDKKSFLLHLENRDPFSIGG